MANSYRTQKESILASRRMKKDNNGDYILPRVIEKKPAKDDMHPISKSMLNRILNEIPLEYLYGLKRIELRGRNDKIGNPFGYYISDENAIILFSLPMNWCLEYISPDLEESLLSYGVEITECDNNYLINLKDEMRASLWFYCYVLAHELGHHYVEQYKNKNSREMSKSHNELVADLHSIRLRDDLYKKLREKTEG